jgi:hypothetical protein
MKIVRDKISIAELEPMAQKMFGGLVKAVVDIEQEIMVVDAELHSDEEELLLEQEGSEQGNLWGINIHPDRVGHEDWIVFDSMINLRPSWGNRSRGVDDPAIQEKIKQIVTKLVVR